MNILISCPGRRVEMLEVFNREFAKFNMEIIATGNSNILPALYSVENSYIVPSLEDDNYVEELLEICKEHDVKAILTMLDKDIMVLSKNIDNFKEIGVIPILPNLSAAEICDNKYLTYEFLTTNGIRCAKSYNDLETFEDDYSKNKISFPVIVKPNSADGSRGVIKCTNMKELEKSFHNGHKNIIQEFLNGTEYDIDAYIDIYSQKMVSIFAKEKLSMTIGGADKVISYKDQKLFDFIEDLSNKLNITGPIDVDVFKVNGEYYIGEINPRFGANYICAYGCGVNFLELLINNINGKTNVKKIGNYSDGILMMKYERIMFKAPNEIIGI